MSAGSNTVTTPVMIESQAQFNQCVTTHDFLVLLFTAKWCDPCQPFAPVFAEVAAQYPQAVFATADIDLATDLAANFRVTQVPALMAIRERVVIEMVNGAMHAHELNHHVQMGHARDRTTSTAHLDQRSSPG